MAQVQILYNILLTGDVRAPSKGNLQNLARLGALW